MTIKAIRMFDGGFISQPFAFGGEDGKEAAASRMPEKCDKSYF